MTQQLKLGLLCLNDLTGMEQKHKLFFVSLGNMFSPALFMHINTTFSTVEDVGSGFPATNRAFHDFLPPSISLFFGPLVSSLSLLSSLESVT